MEFPIDIQVGRLDMVSYLVAFLLLSVAITMLIQVFMVGVNGMVNMFRGRFLLDLNFSMKRSFIVIMMVIYSISIYKINFLEETTARVNVGHEESPYYLIGKESTTENFLVIEMGKLYYVNRDIGDDYDYLYDEDDPYFVELGKINVDRENMANFTPTSPLGESFLKYGEYIQQNPQLKEREVSHELDIEGKITMRVYDEEGKETEVIEFKGV